jgi:hypothetical protein
MRIASTTSSIAWIAFSNSDSDSRVTLESVTQTSGSYDRPMAAGVDEGDVAADHPARFEVLDASKTRGGCQTYPVGQFDVAQAGVVLQFDNNCVIDVIHSRSCYKASADGDSSQSNT